MLTKENLVFLNGKSAFYLSQFNAILDFSGNERETSTVAGRRVKRLAGIMQKATLKQHVLNPPIKARLTQIEDQ